MYTYYWVGYVGSDTHVVVGRIEVFDDRGGWPINEYFVRYCQVFPCEVDFREWIDDLETDQILEKHEIFKRFALECPSSQIDWIDGF